MASEPDVEADDDPRPLQPGTNVNGVKVVRFVDASQEYSAPKEYFLDGADGDGLYDQDNHSGRKGLPEDAVSLGSYGWSADGVQVPFEDAGTRGRQIRHEKAVRFLSTVLLGRNSFQARVWPKFCRNSLCFGFLQMDLGCGSTRSRWYAVRRLI